MSRIDAMLIFLILTTLLALSPLVLRSMRATNIVAGLFFATHVAAIALLVGFGRWGSSNPWLGVPVKWSDISEVKVIVECGLDNFRIEPSQGTHFFQNMTSFGVGYMTVNPYAGAGTLDFDLLDSMPALYESEYIRHVRFDSPLAICIDGVKNRGIVEIE